MQCLLLLVSVCALAAPCVLGGLLRGRRQGMPGGWFPGDVKDPTVINLLNEVYFEAPSTAVGREHVNLIQVESQVVSGFNYRMTFDMLTLGGTCEVVIYTQSWTDTTDILKDTCTDRLVASWPLPADSPEDEVDNPRDRRQGKPPNPPGGWFPGDVQDTAVINLLNEVYFTADSTAVRPRHVNLIQVEKQVVSGFNYRMTFDMLELGGTCEVVIYTQSWTNTNEIRKDTCTDRMVASWSMPGGWGPADDDDPNVSRLFNEVYSPSSSLSLNEVDLLLVEQQVVAGVNYRYNFTVRKTQETCQVVIFFQSWTNTEEVLSDTCGYA